MMAMIVIAIILLVDQIVKIWVKTHMSIGETVCEWTAFNITWFRMTFIENNGAAGGMQLFGSKAFLTLFRLVAIGFVGYYMWILTKKEEISRGFYLSLALILAGAAGNLIDSLFYGLCFTTSTYYDVSQFVGLAGEGHYAGFLEGRVVDMFELPFTFIWNIADAAITIGVALLILVYRKDLSLLSKKSD
jgi:signal peptidase II